MKPLLYEAVARRVEAMIEKGLYEPGERLPSIRELKSQLSVGVNTVREAYALLESRGIVEPRAQSGHFVAVGPPLCTDAEMDYSHLEPGYAHEVRRSALTQQMLDDGTREDVLNLATAEPPAQLLPTKRLAELTARGIRRDPAAASRYGFPPGPYELRQTIARRLVRGGVTYSAENVVLTAGCLEAVYLSLSTICRPGDAVVVESPGFYLYYQLLERLHLKAVEVPCRPGTGVDPHELEAVLAASERSGRPKVRAALLVPNFSSPLGALMPEAAKRDVAEVLSRYGVYIIEDDMYGDMAWGCDRPASLARYTEPERTLLCASFSKSIAPGYRIGWVAAGAEPAAQIRHAKLLTSVGVSAPAAIGVSEFLRHGGYDRWLRRARQHYRQTFSAIRRVVAETFPAGTTTTNPQGGMTIWVALPRGRDATTLYEHARERGIIIAPGVIFAPTAQYCNCLRLNATYFDDEVRDALTLLGTLVDHV